MYSNVIDFYDRRFQVVFPWAQFSVAMPLIKNHLTRDLMRRMCTSLVLRNLEVW